MMPQLSNGLPARHESRQLLTGLTSPGDCITCNVVSDPWSMMWLAQQQLRKV